MNTLKESPPKKRTEPAAANRQSASGQSGISLYPPVQKKSNSTGLPDQLKDGAESLSDISLDDVKVHYNSSKPAQLNAHAFAQGTDIHIGASQEKHLPHEVWHVIQQKQGRVKPTTEISGISINDSAALEKEADEMGSHSAINRHPVQKQPVSSNETPSTVLQRSAGDERLLEELLVQAELAKRGFELIENQSDVATRQMDLLEAILTLDNFADHPEAAQAADKIRESASAIRNEIEASAASVLTDRDTVVARGQQVTIETPTALLLNWKGEGEEKIAAIRLVQAKITASAERMRNESVQAARAAMSMSELDSMKRLLSIADALHATLEGGNNVIRELNRIGSGKSSFKEKVSTATVVSDSINNATTGLAFGVVGAVDAGTVFSLSTTAGSVLGYLGGGLGILFGAIGTFLGIKNAILGGTKRSKLNKVKPKISNENMDEITDFAIHQKGKKIGRNIAGTTAGLFAITAGAIGLAATIAGTMGTAAIVLGIAAGLIGLGFVVFKIFRSLWKRGKERKVIAEKLIQKIRDNDSEAAEARTIVQNTGLSPNDVDQPKFKEKLAKKVGDYAKSKRTEMAEGLVKALVDGKPSESFDAEIILNALGVNPVKIRALVNEDKVTDAVGKVAGKLASW